MSIPGRTPCPAGITGKSLKETSLRPWIHDVTPDFRPLPRGTPAHTRNSATNQPFLSRSRFNDMASLRAHCRMGRQFLPSQQCRVITGVFPPEAVGLSRRGPVRTYPIRPEAPREPMPKMLLDAACSVLVFRVGELARGLCRSDLPVFAGSREYRP